MVSHQNSVFEKVIKEQKCIALQAMFCMASAGLAIYDLGFLSSRGGLDGGRAVV